MQSNYSFGASNSPLINTATFHKTDYLEPIEEETARMLLDLHDIQETRIKQSEAFMCKRNDPKPYREEDYYII